MLENISHRWKQRAAADAAIYSHTHFLPFLMRGIPYTASRVQGLLRDTAAALMLYTYSSSSLRTGSLFEKLREREDLKSEIMAIYALWESDGCWWGFQRGFGRIKYMYIHFIIHALDNEFDNLYTFFLHVYSVLWTKNCRKECN